MQADRSDGVDHWYSYMRSAMPPENITDNWLRVTRRLRDINYVCEWARMRLIVQGFSDVMLTALGMNISKAVMFAEEIKRRISGLHQITKISTFRFNQTFVHETRRHPSFSRTIGVPKIEIILSTEMLDCTSSGYQAPVADNRLALSNFVVGSMSVPYGAARHEDAVANGAARHEDAVANGSDRSITLFRSRPTALLPSGSVRNQTMLPFYFQGEQSNENIQRRDEIEMTGSECCQM
ncbi:hypothetical protein KP509_12G078800 [Ceratopteris richardii]|uniref:DNA/RNA-binding protein Alba-like domain-containing protein n=1 Tax=Ceratopteris richardii TaxID=49495 RepID=A0A8T2TKG1_CERRI|nr:hypothetical protein KP509_12G078800 [Ceratopteris richardii]